MYFFKYWFLFLITLFSACSIEPCTKSKASRPGLVFYKKNETGKYVLFKPQNWYGRVTDSKNDGYQFRFRNDSINQLILSNSSDSVLLMYSDKAFNDPSGRKDSIKIGYFRRTYFVSEQCGFDFVFEMKPAQLKGEGLADSIETIANFVDSSRKAHLNIYLK